MRIDIIGSVPSSGAVKSGESVKKTEKEQKSEILDRVEICTSPTVKDINDKIKDSIARLDKNHITAKRLEEIKQSISQNSYYVSTEEIVKKIL